MRRIQIRDRQQFELDLARSSFVVMASVKITRRRLSDGLGSRQTSSPRIVEMVVVLRESAVANLSRFMVSRDGGPQYQSASNALLYC
jgi:hypothetical protein